MNKIILSLVIAILGLTANGAVIAATYTYTGVVTLCTGTCAPFASLDVGSQISGIIEINTTASNSFGDADVGPFTFSVLNPVLPLSGPVGDPVNDNPLVVDSTLGIAASNGTAGTTDGTNEINGGQMLIEFLVPPFSSNGAFIVFDLSTGDGKICLFFATAGCIPGATEAVIFEGQFSNVDPDTDTDGDGDPDSTDPDDDNDGIGDELDAQPLTYSNSCTGGNHINATLISIVENELTCAARETITVLTGTKVQGSGNLHLIADTVIFQSYVEANKLDVIAEDSCPECP